MNNFFEVLIMKAIPNFISLSRIVLSLILIFVKPLGAAFYVIYIISGISDMADGFIARKTGTTSSFGEKLDSIADFIIIFVLLFIIYPIVKPTAGIIIWIVSIAIVKLASTFIAMIRYKTFAMLHTYGNKITGMVLFLFPIMISFTHTKILMYIICAIASISAFEEFIIQLTSRELNVNRQSIFSK